MAIRTLAALSILAVTALASPIDVASAAALSRHRNCATVVSDLENGRCTNDRRPRLGERNPAPSEDEMLERTGPKVEE